jgi:hypothetical protein
MEPTECPTESILHSLGSKVHPFQLRYKNAARPIMRGCCCACVRACVNGMAGVEVALVERAPGLWGQEPMRGGVRGRAGITDWNAGTGVAQARTCGYSAVARLRLGAVSGRCVV